jgi:hypothetical protein
LVSQFLHPVEAANFHRARYLIKQALDQINQQAACERGQHCPEEVQHRHNLLSEVVPTSGTYKPLMD